LPAAASPPFAPPLQAPKSRVAAASATYGEERSKERRVDMDFEVVGCSEADETDETGESGRE
jgi:hypothetical protein